MSVARGTRIPCPGGCGKTVAVHAKSGRISTHDDPHRPVGSRLCRAAGKTRAELAAEGAAAPTQDVTPLGAHGRLWRPADAPTIHHQLGGTP